MRSYLKIPAATCIGALATLTASIAHADLFAPGNLIVSRSVYQGTSSTVVVGQGLPPGTDAGAAVADGTYPTVFNNSTVDGSFGVTSPIFVDSYSVAGGVATLVSTLSVDPNKIVTSFSSKSELALNLSTDGQYVTFLGYVAPVNAIDVSNSNTPNHPDPTNPVPESFPRAVARVDSRGNTVVTPVNTYSGNNGRAVILDRTNNQYLLVGNAGNGASPEPLAIVTNTGVQTVGVAGGPETLVVGAQQGSLLADGGVPANGLQFGYSVAQNGFAVDKSGKDDNFRGMALFNNTLYVTKGSGGNGVNTVYQVGSAGTIPTAGSAATTAFSILPGFPATLAKNAGAAFPFAIWFADPNTLYVADEGDGKAAGVTGGLQKWVLQGGIWSKAYTLAQGLNLGVQYVVTGLPSTLNPSPDGLRSLTGKLNGDGTATLFAVTSTVSASGDQGADPNQLVTISDNVSFTTAAQASGESFALLQTAPAGQVLRGVSLSPVTPPPPPVPVPPAAIALMALLLAGIGAVVVKREVAPGNVRG
jgi:hypothetical protein